MERAAAFPSRCRKQRDFGSPAARARAIAILALAYFAFARLGLTLHHVNDVASLIWAPAGIALAALVLHGMWMWPAIAIGSVLNVVASGHSLYAGMWVAGVNVLEVLVSAYLLRNVARMRPGLDRVRDVFALIVVGIMASLASATLATGGLGLFDLMPSSRAPQMWSAWWWGHLSADLIVAPLILTWSQRHRTTVLEPRPRRIEAILLSLSLCAITMIVIRRWFPASIGLHAPYYLIPLLLWTGMRFGPFGAAIASFSVNTFVIVGTSFGSQPYRDLSDLQTVLAVSSVTALTLGALALERMRAVRIKTAILQGALDAIITLDADDCVVEFNPAAERLFGFTKAEMLGKPVAPRLVAPEMRGAYQQLLEKHLRSANEVNRIRTIARRADRTTFPIELSITHVPIDDRVLVTGFVRDITAEISAEAAARESHELLERSVDRKTAEIVRSNAELERRERLLRRAEALARLGSFELDLKAGAVKWSDELYRIYGRDKRTHRPTYDEFLSQVHPDDRMRIASALARALRDYTPFAVEERIVRPDGTVRVLQTQAEVFVDDNGHAVRISGCCQDITERKHAEAARDRLAELVESSEDAIIGLTLEGVIESWNAAATRIFGFRCDEVIGQPYSKLVPTEQASSIEAGLAQVLSGTHLAHREMTHQRADGSQFDASVTVSAINDPFGRTIGFSKVLRDITEMKLAEKQLRTSLHEKEVMLGEIHHRVKNNLQVISSLLNLQVASDPSSARGLRESQSRVQSMALVHQLLYRSKDFSHIDLGEYLQGLAERLVATYQIGRDRISILVEAPPIRIDIDRAIPCALILNELVTNSLQHAFPNDRRGTIRVTIEQLDDQIVLTVKDDGVGLPAQLRTDRSFGLRIARTLTTQLAGTLDLASNGGTTARLAIPTRA